jgi:hypothetical protein
MNNILLLNNGVTKLGKLHFMKMNCIKNRTIIKACPSMELLQSFLSFLIEVLYNSAAFLCDSFSGERKFKRVERKFKPHIAVLKQSQSTEE